jgi:protein-tyrosine phosphatase
MTVADALVHVRKARPLAVETLEQEAILQEFVSTIQTQLLDAQIENRR